MQQAQTAYRDITVPTRTDRALEYEAIARVTAELKATSNTNAEFRDIVAAVDQNRKLWRFVATSVSDPDNLLSKDLRAQLFFIAEFVFLHTKSVLKKEADLGPLIDVNLSIMRGLGKVPN